MSSKIPGGDTLNAIYNAGSEYVQTCIDNSSSNNQDATWSEVAQSVQKSANRVWAASTLDDKKLNEARVEHQNWNGRNNWCILV